MAILPKVIYRSNAISIKISTAFIAGMEKLILKFIWNFKGPSTAKIILKKNRVEDPHFPIAKLTTKL